MLPSVFDSQMDLNEYDGLDLYLKIFMLSTGDKYVIFSR